MAKDLKGIHKYTEADTKPTFSELMNIGMDSVSDSLKYFADTTAKRLALDPAPAGAMWQDTDNQKRLWSTGPNGKWRLHEGKISDIARPWSAVTSPIWGRTISFSIPTVLAPDETLEVVPEQHAGVWIVASNGGIARNATDTLLTVHAARLLNAGETAVVLIWRVVKVGP